MVGLEQEALRDGGRNCVKYLRTEKRVGETKKLKRGRGMLGPQGGCLIKGGLLEPPYEL